MGSSSETTELLGQHLCEYTRKEAIPSMRTNNIPLKNYGFSLHLYIPNFGVTEIPIQNQAGQPSVKNTGIQDVLYSHLGFRYSTPSENNRDEASILQQCISEVRTIALFFPDIRATNIRVCMAAWLGTLCSIDDLIEDMMPNEASAVLYRSLQALQEECSLTSPQHAVVEYFIAFKRHCSTYLSLEVARHFFDSVCITLEGLLDEIRFNQGYLPYNLETYMSIRGRTIGIKPFFTLIKSILETTDHQWSTDIIGMERDIFAIIGLQNDLIGLEKDIRTEQQMNAVIVNAAHLANKIASAEKDAALQIATNNISALHNQLIEHVLEKRAKIHQRAIGKLEDTLESRFADIQLLFTETHLKWCTSAKRYTLTAAELNTM
ncbi:isoprenoid synthase domain-containing protein [Aspergillus pseudotamarii]|uniref:Isoprenoid synthase domain-containing protein n=1 Tax=Aspergillus pseudotamarii TaxID=132259 RepID=A0A5N6SW87_ASPPS|nr:isoprenoid synthase domain-containing protein [Aspergillus pseudotamarii]KAE8137384.1 isoprenoid synthase domain-containing protein [Aspergillus pseudotamarii]